MLGDKQTAVLDEVHVVKVDLNAQKQKMDLLALLTSFKDDPPREKIWKNRPISTRLNHVKSVRRARRLEHRTGT